MLLLFFVLFTGSVVYTSGQYEQHKTFVASQLERPWSSIFDDDHFGARIASSPDSLVAVSTKSSLSYLFSSDAYNSGFDQAKSNGRVYVYDFGVSYKEPAAVIENPVASSNTGFGQDAIAITTNKLIVGDSKLHDAAGRVYVYQRLVDHNWTLTQVLSPPVADSSPYQFFGKSLDVTNNGSTLVVTASGVNTFMGAVYVYHLKNDAYALSQELTGDGDDVYDDDGYYDYQSYDDDSISEYGDYQADDDVATFDDYQLEDTTYSEFGRSLSLDENQLVVSQARNENMTACVKLYQLAGGKFFLKDTFFGDFDPQFGDLVYIKDDVLLIRAKIFANESDLATSVVNLYSRNDAKSGFQLQHQLSGKDPYNFGDSLAIIDDLLLIGASHESSGEALYTLSIASNPDYFNGSRLIMRLYCPLLGSGSVYVYQNGHDDWSLTSNKNKRKLVAKNGLEYDLFGEAIARSLDDGMIFIAASNKRASGFSRAGAVYFIDVDEIDFIDGDDAQEKTHRYIQKSLFSLVLLGVILPLVFFWCWPKSVSSLKEKLTFTRETQAQEDDEVVAPFTIQEGHYFAFDPTSKSIKMMTPGMKSYEVVDLDASYESMSDGQRSV